MTDAEVRRYSEALQRTHRVVYGLVSRGDRSSVAYRTAVAELSAAVAYASELLASQPEAAGRSRGRSSERPPYGVSVDTWREFVAQFNAARTTWFNETGSGVAVTSAGGLIQPAGGSSMALDAAAVTRWQQLVLTANNRVLTLAPGASDFEPALAALRVAAISGARSKVGEYARSIGQADWEHVDNRPPPGVSQGAWAALLQAIRGAMDTLRRLEPAAAPTAAQRQPAAATAAPSASRPGPAATKPGPSAPAARQRQQRRPQQPRGGGRGGGGSGAELELPSPSDLPGAAAHMTREAMQALHDGLNTATGTIDALRTVGSIFTALPSDIIGGNPVTAPLTIVDRLLLAATVLNPPSVPFYARPWFWPAILGTTAYLGYYYYTKHQRESATKKKAAPAKPAAALPAAP